MHCAISLLVGCDLGSKLDFDIQAVALVLSVSSFAHGNGDLSCSS